MSALNQTKEKAGPGQGRSFQIVVFKLGTEEYALQIGQIKEVVLTPTITRMPQTPEHIKGVANIRGNIIAIVDLQERFGLGASNGSVGRYTLVVESEEFKMGVLVPDVPNTLAISESAIDQSIMNVEGEHNYIKGIVKLESRLIILIDIFKVMELKDIGQTLGKTAA
jgi:purine-binding chemotaxis protein CheW